MSTQIAIHATARKLLTKYDSGTASLVIFDPPEMLSESPDSDSTLEDQAKIMQSLVAKAEKSLSPGGSVVMLSSSAVLSTAFTLGCTYAGLHSVAEISVLWNTDHKSRSLIQAASKASSIRWYVKPGHRGKTYRTLNLPSNVLVAQPVPFIARKNPAQRPVELFNYILSVMSDKNGLVLDPFCGSGSSLVSAALTDRNAVGADHDPEQVEIANARLVTVEDELLSPLYWWLGRNKYKPVE